jgi:hypothetical protein
MHVANNSWISGHMNSSSACETCHGSGPSNFGNGTELSEAKADRTISTGTFGTKTFWRGYRIGCYTCHNGSSTGSSTPWSPATIANVGTNTTSGTPVFIPLAAQDINTTLQPVTVRVITQPSNGTVEMTNWNTTNWAAIYYPDQGFVGTNIFTFAAWNTRVDSLLRTGTVVVAQGPFSISAKAFVPTNYPLAWAAPFGVVAAPSNIVGTLTYDWNFGDGSAHRTNQYTTHAYTVGGAYNWRVISTVSAPTGSASTTNSGTIGISAPMVVTASASGGNLTLTWPQPTGDALLEQTASLTPTHWTVVTNAVVVSGGQVSVTVPIAPGTMFYRLRQP